MPDPTERLNAALEGRYHIERELAIAERPRRFDQMSLSLTRCLVATVMALWLFPVEVASQAIPESDVRAAVEALRESGSPGRVIAILTQEHRPASLEALGALADGLFGSSRSVQRQQMSR